MTPLGAPSIPKYGSLVRPDAQIATAIERGGTIRIGPLVGKDGARWLYNPCRLGDPHRLRAGGRIRKEPTSGQGGYITPLGAFGARWLLGPIPLTTNCRPEAPGGGGLVGVLGPAESPPPYPPPTSPPYLRPLPPPPTSPPYLPPLAPPTPPLPPPNPPLPPPLPPPTSKVGGGGRLRAIYDQRAQEVGTNVHLYGIRIPLSNPDMRGLSSVSIMSTLTAQVKNALLVYINAISQQQAPLRHQPSD